MSNQAVPGIERVALLTGGADRPYAFGLATALLARGIPLDVIGSDELDAPAFHAGAAVRFVNLRGSQRRSAGLVRKAARVLLYYARLVRYGWTSDAQVFHILWNNKFEIADRVLLMALYRLTGRRVVLTAHNVNARKRDGRDTLLNRL